MKKKKSSKSKAKLDKEDNEEYAVSYIKSLAKADENKAWAKYLELKKQGRN